MNEIKLPPRFGQSLQTELRTSIQQWHAEVKKLLPNLPSQIDIEFDDEYLVPGFGTGGAASGLNAMKLAYNPEFDASQNELIAELKATYYHEAYHLTRGFSFETTPHDLPAIKNAIEEGLATKFEVVYTDSKPGYAQYEDRKTMLAWLEEVRNLPDGFDYDWQRWKFFDPETGRKWILYRVGVFIVDEALKNESKLTIKSISTLSVDDITALSKL
jgi:uncharacterized protein YjaZ